MNKKTEMPELKYYGCTNRYICSVLDEMRECLKSLNFAYFGSLIEEAQMLANRMEAALDDQKCRKDLLDDIKALEETRDKLEIEVKELIKNRDNMEEVKDV